MTLACSGVRHVDHGARFVGRALGAVLDIRFRMGAARDRPGLPKIIAATTTYLAALSPSRRQPAAKLCIHADADGLEVDWLP
jgi:hypothetical protein